MANAIKVLPGMSRNILGFASVLMWNDPPWLDGSIGDLRDSEEEILKTRVDDDALARGKGYAKDTTVA